MLDLTDWLRLWHTPGVGPKTYNFLIGKFATPTEVFNHSRSDLLSLGLTESLVNAIKTQDLHGVDKDLAWEDSNQSHHILTLYDPRYPACLHEISQTPPILYACGDLRVLNDLSLAIVGTRKASQLGKFLAHSFSKQLTQLGLVITSGLALGVDTQAHIGAVSTPGGKTIAVLGNGLDRIYPKQNKALSHKIVENGLLISEFPIGTRPLPQHFPRRNRIISGLSMGTVVIEAATKSGSLITASYALEQGREVFAVPGPVNNPLSSGCHQLIQQGAKLITDINDILVELQGLFTAPQRELNSTKNLQDLSADLANMLTHLDYTPLSIDQLIEKSGLTPEQVSSMLTQLEMGGHITCDAFGQYSRLATDVK